MLRAPEVWGVALQTDSPTAHRHTTDGVPLTRGHTLPVGSVAPIGSFKEVRPCPAGCKQPASMLGATLRQNLPRWRPGTAAGPGCISLRQQTLRPGTALLDLCFVVVCLCAISLRLGQLLLPEARAEGLPCVGLPCGLALCVLQQCQTLHESCFV